MSSTFPGLRRSRCEVALGPGDVCASGPGKATGRRDPALYSVESHRTRERTPVLRSSRESPSLSTDVRIGSGGERNENDEQEGRNDGPGAVGRRERPAMIKATW